MIKTFSLLAAALVAFLHFYRLPSIPGLHYDEAWAMNYAWRIAHEKGFYPISAMSPYTAPWTHYWAALWLRVLGPSVLVFRASQVSLALTGLVLLALALPRHVRASFPWAVLLLPGLLMNDRFAIELTGFHVLCFGAMLWALRARRPALAGLAALLGTTAHILFYAVPLALAAECFLGGARLEKRARVIAVTYFSLMAAFFVRVLLSVPEKGKAGALVFSAVALAGLLAAGAERWAIWKSPRWRLLVGIGAAVYAVNCLFFAEGFWGAEVATGVPYKIAFLWVGFFIVAAAGARGYSAVPARVARAFLLLTVACGALMLKPAPRYFELPMLGLAALLSYDFSTWLYAPWSRRYNAVTVLAVLLGVNFGLAAGHYLLTDPVDSPLQFLAYKDSSRDFLDKQGLAGFLGSSGCALNDIHTDDPRLKEELTALSLGDWPVDRNGPCRWNFVARRSDANAKGEPWGEFVLRRKN